MVSTKLLANTIHLFRSTVDYYNSKGSTVYTASLDISKAFDMITHYQLFDSLIKAGIPGWIIDILVNWYSKLTVKVIWNGNLSHSFIVQSGVRQGSCLSPSLFNVFIDICTCELRKLNVGCHICNEFVGCLLYADDIIILSSSINGLQSMLDVCSVTSRSLYLNFNCSK